ncbi:ATP-grasp domain-containing protein [Streptacidiphilus sp. ASG 303]|uniref:ATP-grasp domain-containing protein n=1 Tax=Streptacidiphilus sp. ASG 303 TaxID=2896847 RepID=UPI001E56AD61|nr:ATP-grasp domain-containing protein [Streptacidiphilus sp. ASG 303]MCD0484239.1 ATP-grasp domain-containing protein [Streptacidiphilus sp. ASG 303]
MRNRNRLIVVGSRLRAYREYAMASLAGEYDLALVTSRPLTWEQEYVTAHRIADTADAAALRPAVEELLAEAAADGCPRTGVYTWDESSLTATAEVAGQLGLPHLSAAAAAACRDKYATRRLLDRAGLPAVRHRLVHTAEEAAEAAAAVGYPLVLKPRALAGSMGVTLVRGPEEFPDAWARTASTVLPGLPAEAGVLVEEFLDGPEISVDSCVLDGVAEPVVVARKRLGFDPGFEEVGHLVGPWRHEPWARPVEDLVRAAHRALGIEVGVTHTEIRLTASGPRLIELNGRLGGDLIPRVGALATGVDLPLAAAALALGRRPALDAAEDRWAEIRFLYPPHDGVLEHLDLGAAAAVPGVAEVVPLAGPGDELLLPPRALTPRTAAVVAVGPDPAACTAALDAAEAEIRPVMAGSAMDGLGALLENPVTRRYLAAERGLEHMTVPGVRNDWIRYGAGGGQALNRPVFLAAADRLRLEADLNGLFDLLTTIPDRLFDGDRRAFARAVGMTPTQVDLVMRGAGRRMPPMSRADMYREPAGFKLMELNTGSSLGGWQMGEFARTVREDRAFRAFADAEHLVHPDPVARIAAVLREEAAAAGFDLPERPVLAITEWPDGYAKTKPWLDFVVPDWLRNGFDAVVCHLGELDYRDGDPYVHGRRVDVVYRIFLPGELEEGQRSHDLVDPLLDAVERGRTFLFAGLDCELYGNKGSLAMLSDERNRGAFGTAEHALVERILPWTRFLRDEKVQRHGESVDLLPYVLAHQDRLALKPTLLYGGVGVVPGWSVGPEEWEAHVRGAVGGPFVVQERVLPVAERFVADSGRGFERMVVAYGVLMVGSEYSGMLVRGTPDPGVGIVSMSNGAQIGCCFHVAGPGGGAA